MAPHPWRPPNKRPRPSSSRKDQSESTEPVYPSTAYIQAYEAQLVYGQSGSSFRGRDDGTAGQGVRGGSRERMIRWAGAEEGEEVWADRYNMLHLLPSLPSAPSHARLEQFASRPRSSSPASSSSSWDDLPSDQEQLFDLSGDEAVEAYEREKKRKWMERLREDRLKEREEEDGAEDVRREEATSRAEVNDELPESTRTLMHHTAKSIYASPNPKTLEMRILANHAGDARFAFLRGRWTGEWEKAKRGARVEMGLEKESIGVGLLGGYGSESDDESEDEEVKGEDGEEGGEAVPPDDEPPPPPPPPDEGDEAPPSPPRLDGILETPDPKSSLISDRGSDRFRLHDADVDPVEMAVRQAEKDLEEEEKKRIRREKLEEWKRSKRKAAESALTGELL